MENRSAPTGSIPEVLAVKEKRSKRREDEMEEEYQARRQRRMERKRQREELAAKEANEAQQICTAETDQAEELPYEVGPLTSTQTYVHRKSSPS